ncbi:hypothetical protein T12_14759 [Trichinella patagoniensis]|uniref:Uncharacterized protein n=1 Tax=Trichinella patagoniensis TaxID=990121 RepID=A0A0V0ZTX5_9BILA|nr:hypothetical protein T12_14759 [Trichinella patagoniensis]
MDFLTLFRVIYTCPAHLWEDQRVLIGTWIDKGKDSVNPVTAWVLTKINGISRSADSWVVNANHKVHSNPSSHDYWVGIPLLDSHLYEIFRIS